MNNELYAVPMKVELSVNECNAMLAKLEERHAYLTDTIQDTELDIWKWNKYREQVTEALAATALSRSERSLARKAKHRRNRALSTTNRVTVSTPPAS